MKNKQLNNFLHFVMLNRMKLFLGPAIATTISLIIMFFIQGPLHIDKYLTDVGGISAFLVVFGAIYGIMAAFIVVEVWVKFNATKHVLEQEAEGVEKLFLFILYFRDEELTKRMKKLVHQYITLLREESFSSLGIGSKHIQEEKVFREMSTVIRDIKLKDDHDKAVFGPLVEHYTDLAQTRVERIHHSTLRLPQPLHIFFYVTSIFTIITFIFMPFANIYYGLLVTGFLVFCLTMLTQIINDLDNPFAGGFWRLTPEPFEEALLHIEESY